MQSIRTCINCKKKFDKVELIRYVSNLSKLVKDTYKKSPGKGVYLCEVCLKKVNSNTDIVAKLLKKLYKK